MYHNNSDRNGPVLTKKVVLMEPFYEFLPPLTLSDDEWNCRNFFHMDDFLLQNLPTPIIWKNLRMRLSMNLQWKIGCIWK